MHADLVSAAREAGGSLAKGDAAFTAFSKSPWASAERGTDVAAPRVALLLETVLVSPAKKLISNPSSFYWPFLVTIALLVLLAMGCTACWTWRMDGSEARMREPLAKARAASVSSSCPNSMAVESGSPCIKRRNSAPAATTARAPESRALCPLLVVPEGTRLACVVQNHCCRKRQEFDFHVYNARSHGGLPLVQVRVSELSGGEAGIRLETLGGKEALAFLSTEELWLGSSRPRLTITRPSGVAYGSLRPETTGEYTLRAGDATCWTFSGDFRGHWVDVKDPAGHDVAHSWPGPSEDEYQVFVQSQEDAGLVILALMAVDKCEIEPSSP